MTAEITILNKYAVALAADSAVTLQRGQGVKVIPSAEKIFSLSKYQPVAAMIYGNAAFLDVPWEIIIKLYRASLGTKAFDTLDDYANDFLQFLRSRKDLFPESSQDFFYATHMVELFYH